MSLDPRPLILTALAEAGAQGRFEGWRRAHYPVALNQVPAHITLFHHLPGSELEAVKRRLKAVCGQLPPPVIAVTGLRSLGPGVALKLQSPDLEAVRAELAEGWQTLLIPQDRQGFRPHLTIQNKVTAAEARATLQRLEAVFQPFVTHAVAVAIWRYLGGPWQLLGQVGFRGR